MSWCSCVSRAGGKQFDIAGSRNDKDAPVRVCFFKSKENMLPPPALGELALVISTSTRREADFPSGQLGEFIGGGTLGWTKIRHKEGRRGTPSPRVF